MQCAEKDMLQTCIELIKYGLVTESYKELMGRRLLNYAIGLERGLLPRPPSLVPSPVISVVNDSSEPDSLSEGHEEKISAKNARATTHLVKTLDLSVRKLYNLFFFSARDQYKDYRALHTVPTPELINTENDNLLAYDEYQKIQALGNILDKKFPLIKLSYSINRWKQKSLEKYQERNHKLGICLKSRIRILKRHNFKVFKKKTETCLSRPKSRLTPADKRDVIRSVVKAMMKNGRANTEQRAMWKWAIITFETMPIGIIKPDLGIKLTERLNTERILKVFRKASVLYNSVKKRSFNALRDPDLAIVRNLYKNSLSGMSIIHLRNAKKNLKPELLDRLISQISIIRNTRNLMNKDLLWKWFSKVYTSNIKIKAIANLFLTIDYLHLKVKNYFNI